MRFTCAAVTILFLKLTSFQKSSELPTCTGCIVLAEMTKEEGREKPCPKASLVWIVNHWLGALLLKNGDRRAEWAD
jgi:hypothetical protein